MNRSKSKRWHVLLLLMLASAGILYRFRGHAMRYSAPVIIAAFHWLYYNSLESTWANTRWLGNEILKNPLDLWVFQEIIYETKPDVIVETGTYKGGSALHFANLFDLMGRGQIVTVDIKEFDGIPKHPRIHYLLGSSTAPELVDKIKAFIGPEDKVMVTLDSDHSESHVIQELRIYSRLVTKGNYLVVEDTNINGHPVCRSFGPGPMEAVQRFLRENSDFVVDRTREKFLLTHNPGGYLRKVR